MRVFGQTITTMGYHILAALVRPSIKDVMALSRSVETYPGEHPDVLMNVWGVLHIDEHD